MFHLLTGVSDLECIVDELRLERFILLGFSQGGPISIAYTARRPERVSQLIIYGSYSRGFLHRGDSEKQQQFVELNRTLIREGWGSDHDTYRQWFTSQFIPGATAEQARRFNELERVSATAAVMERFIVALSKINVVDLLPTIRVPTLVFHCKDEVRVPFDLGKEIAAGIPGAKFVPLESKNHIFLANEPAHRVFFDALASFLGERPFKGPLPGTDSLKEHFEIYIKAIEQNWFIRIILILAAIIGIIIFFEEMWRASRHYWFIIADAPMSRTLRGDVTLILTCEYVS